MRSIRRRKLCRKALFEYISSTIGQIWEKSSSEEGFMMGFPGSHGRRMLAFRFSLRLSVRWAKICSNFGKLKGEYVLRCIVKGYK